MEFCNNYHLPGIKQRKFMIIRQICRKCETVNLIAIQKQLETLVAREINRLINVYNIPKTQLNFGS